MGIVLATVLMLIASNVFMTFAWYGHLKDLKDKPWLLAAIVSWFIAFFEYLIQVPANRIGSTFAKGSLRRRLSDCWSWRFGCVLL